ncbi:MAG: methionine--tRNA ligase [Candidatus Levybacteria bacterium]|nr:methionine--tRNA ligase [Candidatus Levybacteria bacterium]
MSKFYITTAIPYVNGKPHIGHALEYFQADVIRNYHELLGEETLLLSGADENALKNVQTAEAEGIPTQKLLDRNSKVFEDSYAKLGVKLNVFERGSDSKHHFPGVQKLWELCNKNGDIYKKSYTGLYCVGCESFKTEKELTEGKCPDHQKAPEKVTEENYFFKLSNYQEKLLKLIESNELKIVPISKRNEILSFIKQGLEDFSISRNKERAKGVGVPVPGDDSQVMYVWFDALAIYITGIGYGIDQEMFEKWWPADVHVIGKDINRFHTIYWPAMLMSAGLKIPKTVLVHGFVQSGGAKMSKSLGNVIDPFEIADKYGLEPFRYYMLSQIPTTDDGDFTEERFIEVYNSDLANGLGNLVARVAKLCEKVTFNEISKPQISEEYKKSFEEYKFNEFLNSAWGRISEIDQEIEKEQPWKVEDLEKLRELLQDWVEKINQIAFELSPFLPETSEKIQNIFKEKNIKSTSPLFPRI